MSNVELAAAMTMGSLFDGIGGFPLGAARYGIKTIWASEIEPFPMEVTKRRFPSINHERSEERRVWKECRSRWSPYH